MSVAAAIKDSSSNAKVLIHHNPDPKCKKVTFLIDFDYTMFMLNCRLGGEWDRVEPLSAVRAVYSTWRGSQTV